MSGRVYCPECGTSYSATSGLSDAQCGVRLTGDTWCKGMLTTADGAIRSLARARATAHAAGYAEAVADVDALRAALTEARAVLSLCNTARNRSVPEYLGVRDIVDAEEERLRDAVVEAADRWESEATPLYLVPSAAKELESAVRALRAHREKVGR